MFLLSVQRRLTHRLAPASPSHRDARIASTSYTSLSSSSLLPLAEPGEGGAR